MRAGIDANELLQKLDELEQLETTASAEAVVSHLRGWVSERLSRPEGAEAEADEALRMPFPEEVSDLDVFLDGFQIPGFSCGALSNVHQMNASARKLFGVGWSPVRNIALFRWIAEESKVDFAHFLKGVFQEAGTRSATIWAHKQSRPDERTRVRLLGRRVGSASGDRCVCLAIDMAGGPQEEELLRYNQRYLELFRKLHDGIVLVDARGRVFEANELALKLMSCNQENLMGENPGNLFFWKTDFGREPIWENREQFREDFKPAELLSYDGVFVPIALKAIALADQSFMLVFQDRRQQVRDHGMIRVLSEQYEQMVSGSMDAILGVDFFGQILSANPVYYQWLELASNRPKPRSFFDYVHPDDRAEVVEFFNERSTDRDNWDVRISFRLLSSSKKTLFVEGRVVVLFPDQTEGQASKILVQLRNLTQLLEVRKALRRKELQLQRIFESTFAGICLLDRKGAYTYFNQRWCDMVGYSAQELPQRDFQSLTHPEDLAQSVEAFEKFVATGGQYVLEKRFRRKDGRTIWVLSSVSLLEASQADFQAIVVYIDITEKKELEQALQETQVLQRAILDIIPDHIRVHDWEGRLLVDFSRSLGGPGLDLPLEETFESEEYRAQLSVASQKARGDEPGAHFFSTFENHGRAMHYETRLMPFHEKGFLTMARDITNQRLTELALSAKNQALLLSEMKLQRKTLELSQANRRLTRTQAKLEELLATEKLLNADLLRAKEMAEEANSAKSAFLANVSHELKTPLNAIMGFAEILHLRTVEPSAHQMLDSIRRNGEMLVFLINDLLNFARLEAGKFSIVPEPMHLGQLINEAYALFAEKAHGRGIELRVELAPDMPLRVEADQHRLLQVISNLVFNAIKFTPQGHVTIALDMEDLEQDTGTLLVRVSDTGIGIAPDKLQLIFEAFEQVGARGRPLGTGLGLSIVQKLVGLMAGRVEVGSQVGIGTVFSLRVPGLRILDRAAAGLPIERLRRFRRLVFLEWPFRAWEPEVLAQSLRPDLELLIVGKGQDCPELSGALLCTSLATMKTIPAPLWSQIRAARQNHELFCVCLSESGYPEEQGADLDLVLSRDKFISLLGHLFKPTAPEGHEAKAWGKAHPQVAERLREVVGELQRAYRFEDYLVSAQKLLALGIQHQNNYLQTIAKSIHQHAQAFDLERIQAIVDSLGKTLEP